VSSATLTRGDGRMVVDGRFSLGYPRKDGKDEIDARVRMTGWNLADLRHAFDLDDYPIDGRTSGEYHVYGRYTRPFGFGRMTLADGVAYGETVDSAVLPLRFEGTGIRIDGMELVKGEGKVTGAAYIGWDGKYSFNADGRGIPVESLALFAYPQAPMTGRVQFSVSGASTFAHPMYELRGRIDDLFLKDEGIGQVVARLVVRDEIMSVELEAASPRLAVSGAGQIARAKTADAELTLRFTNTSIDPYLRAFQPGFSPYFQAVASGSLHLVGQIANPEQLLVETTIDQLDLRLFDYRLTNAGPIRMALDRESLNLQQVQLEGEGTRLALTGTASVPDDRMSIVASGEANLAALNLFFPGVRSSGHAELTAEIHGKVSKPMLAGFATLTNGRIRHPFLPHSIDALNGRVSFSNGAVRLDDVSAQIAGGPVVFSGQIGMSGYAPERLALAATAKDLHLRYPERFKSVVDADLTLVGTLAAPTLAGTITVQSTVYRERLDLDFTSLAYWAASRSSSVPAAAPLETAIPLRFDLQIRAPSALRVESNSVNMVSSADLTLRGTLDHPLLFGRAEIERGWVISEGKRYVVTHGTIDFNNPTRIEPVFDFDAVTRIRTPGQTYDVDIRLAGPSGRLTWQLSSDPPLAELEILTLLFGDMPNVQDAELSALRNPNALRNQLVTSRLTQAATTPLTTGVNRAVEETFGLDTFQIRPSVAQDAYQRFSASARLTFGKRISERVYLTYSRSLTSSSRDQVILLEYDQSDRWSWILSQNEDNTYALEVRVRYLR
jgi:translocation and assembly module TamB